MNYRQAFVLVFLLEASFSLYVFLNPLIVGTDGFFFLNSICNNGSLGGETELTQLVFSFLPCHVREIKGVMFLCALFALFAVAKTGELFNKENGWLAGLFVFLSPFFFFEFAKLESELFAFPLLFWANYFVLRGVVGKNLWPMIAGITCVCSAALFWPGAVYYLFSLSLVTVAFWPFALTAVFVFGWKLWAQLFPLNNTWESAPFFACVLFGGFLFTLIGLALEPLVIVPALFWFAVALFNPKFGVHAIPFLAIGALALYNSKHLAGLDRRFKKPIWGTAKQVLVFSCVAMALVAGFSAGVAQPPTRAQFALVEKFVELQDQGLPAKNDWSYGHWVRYAGGHPSAWSGGDWKQDYNGSIALTYEALDCIVLGKANETVLYDCG